MRDRMGKNPRAGIGDSQLDAWMRERAGHMDLLPRGILYGVSCIGQQVDHHLLQVDRAAQYGGVRLA